VTDAEFLTALESCTLPEREFGHAAHVRAAYLCLAALGFAGALQKMQELIQRFAALHGKPTRYHETITVAYLALVRRALFEGGDCGGWGAFAHANPALLERGLLLQYYSSRVLDSDLARQVFLLPGDARSNEYSDPKAMQAPMRKTV
jgi:hypothetical protein